MIQRIQTLFYALASLATGGLFFLPFASSTKATEPYLSDKIYEIGDDPIMLGLAVIGIICPLIAIFLFKNRPVQLRIGLLTIVFNILLPLVSFMLIYNSGKAMLASAELNDEMGIFLPIVAIIFAALGNRFVKKDDNLVKSMDRLR